MSISVRLVMIISAVFLISVLSTCTRDLEKPRLNLSELGYIQPKNSREIQASPFGIQIGSLKAEFLDRASEIGVKWTRLSAGWPNIEKKRGEYRWAQTDTAFSRALDHGITPFVTIDKGNELYTEIVATEPVDLYGKGPAPPAYSTEAMQAWLSFVEALITRYMDRIKYWEIWNEPNHRGFWRPKADAEAYSTLLRETATLIKKIDPEAHVIGGSTAGIDTDFIETFLRAGAADYIDVITFHNYRERVEERLYDIRELWEVVNKYDPEIELWQGETGYPSHSSTTGSRLNSPWGVNIQAKWLLRQALTDVHLCRAKVSNYFKLMSAGDRWAEQKRPELTGVDSILGFPKRGGARVRGVGVNEKALLYHPSNEPKPAYYAYQNLCALLDNRYQPVTIEASVEVKEQGDFYGIAYGDDAFPSVPILTPFKTKDNQFLLFYWLPWSAQENILHYARVDIHTSGVQFEAPVLVDLLTAKVYDINKPKGDDGQLIFADLPMADYPFAIIEKGELTITNNRNTR